MDKLIIEFRRDLRDGYSLHDALCKYNLSLKDAMKLMDKPLTKHKKRKLVYTTIKPYIYQRYKHFIVQKSINNRTVTFGTYNNLNDATLVRDYMVKYGWNRDRLDEICELLHVKRRDNH